MVLGLIKPVAIFAVTSSLLASRAVAQDDGLTDEQRESTAKGKHLLKCADAGCTAGYREKSSCQCNPECVKYKDCCPDYHRLCHESEYSKSGRKNPDPRAPTPDHHKNTPGVNFASGFIRNIKVGYEDGRIIVGYQGMGKVKVRHHMKGHDKMLKEIKGYYKPNGEEVPGPSRVEQIKKWGDRGCWYAEFPAPQLPFDISVDGVTTEHSGSRLYGKVVKPDVEAHIHAKFDAEGKVEFARNRNFEPATLHLDKHPIPIGERYQDHPAPASNKIEL